MCSRLIFAFGLTLLGFSVADAQNIEARRAEARHVLRIRLCGVCHIPPGNEMALNIFDLNKEDWYSTISDRRLSQFKWRIKVKGDEIKEQRGDPKQHTFTQAEIELINAYVDAELKNRNPLQHLLGK